MARTRFVGRPHRRTALRTALLTHRRGGAVAADHRGEDLVGIARQGVAVVLHQANVGRASRSGLATVALRTLRSLGAHGAEFTPRAVGPTLADGALRALRSGRTDLVIGNFSSPTTDHPVTIWKNGKKK